MEVPHRHQDSDSAGFTLLEMLIALAIFAAAFAIAGAAFLGTSRAWRRGTDVLEGLHEGDFLMDQLVAALRSAAWFRTTSGRYGFRLENKGDRIPADTISWVASGSALMSSDSPYRRGLRWLTVSVEETPEGTTALAVRAMPPFLDEDETETPEPWYVGVGVRGLDCRIWDAERAEWSDVWEATNRLPNRIEVSLFFDPPTPGEDPIVLRRLVDIPVAAYATSPVSRTEVRRR